jgi:hypothetical protein
VIPQGRQGPSGFGSAVVAALKAPHRGHKDHHIPTIHAGARGRWGSLKMPPATASGTAAEVLVLRTNDGAKTPDIYRPHEAPGVYFPLAIPAA